MSPDDIVAKRDRACEIDLMRWWQRLFGTRRASIKGLSYRVDATLYSSDAKRAVELRTFSNGATFLLESEWVGGIFQPRHQGKLVGPFPSPEAAEHFIIATPWFNGLST